MTYLSRFLSVTVLGYLFHDAVAAQSITSYSGAICAAANINIGGRLALRPDGLLNNSPTNSRVICPIPRAVGASDGIKDLDLAITFRNADDSAATQSCVLREFSASGTKLQEQSRERNIGPNNSGALEWRFRLDESRVSQLTAVCLMPPRMTLSALTLSVGPAAGGSSHGGSGSPEGEFEFEGPVNAFEAGESVTVSGEFYSVSASTRYFIDNIGPVTASEFFQQVNIGRIVEVTDYLPVDGVADELYLEDPRD
ncbi:MAG: hypothetical protein V2I24_01215 [Halieaceae bacterium]|jgi:hypothetical protein|nr:hypothetical protein [Halieaceae bacterium]